MTKSRNLFLKIYKKVDGGTMAELKCNHWRRDSVTNITSDVVAFVSSVLTNYQLFLNFSKILNFSNFFEFLKIFENFKKVDNLWPLSWHNATTSEVIFVIESLLQWLRLSSAMGSSSIYFWNVWKISKNSLTFFHS